MTLVAGFIEDGCPILIGDLLTSAPGEFVPGDRSLESRPIWRGPNVNISVDHGYRLVGLEQKVVIVSDRLCMAWTGRALYASALLKYLRAAERASPEGSLIELFRAYPREDYRDLEFVAFAREQDRFLSWTSPGMVMMEYPPFQNVCVGGTGAPAFLQLLDTDQRIEPSAFSTSTGYDRWASHALAIVGQLLAKQCFTSFGLEQGWGGGFEIALYDRNHQRFTKLSGILFLMWDLTGVTPSAYTLQCLEPFVFQWSIGERTAFWSDMPGYPTETYVVSPPWSKNSPLPLDVPPPPMTFLPEFVVSFCQRMDANGSGGVGCFAHTSAPRLAWISVQPPKTEINFGKSIAIEVAGAFLPENTSITDFRMYADSMPWPPT
jgi:hypothetical protein